MDDSFSRARRGSVYRLDFADGKSYIGASLLPPTKRFWEHSETARKGGTNPVYVAWRTVGKPKLVIIIKDLCEKELWLVEEKAIREGNTRIPNGYNGVFGSGKAPGMLGKHLTPKQKAKVSKARSGWDPTPATRENMRRAKLGSKQTAEHIENNRQAQLARYQETPRSKETSAKISAALLGIKRSEETKEKNRQSHLGKKASTATKAKMSKTRKGRKLFEEHKEKIRQGVLAFYRTKRETK